MRGLLLLAVFLLFQHLECFNITDHNGTVLYKDVFDNYNPKVRPVFNVSEPLLVNISLDLVKILEVDEINQTFKITVNLLVSWIDEFLTWDGKKYGEIHKMVIPLDKNIWSPDLMNWNAAYNPGEFGQKYASPSIFSNGLVLVWTRVNLETQCEIHTKKYPLDIQHCSVDFTTFMSTDNEVRIINGSNTTSLKFYNKVAEWSITENYVTSELMMIDELTPFRFIRYQFTLQRTCTSCIMNVIIPIIILALLNLLSFFVPTESGEKLAFPMSIFLTLAVFLTIITMSLPESIDGVSYLSTFVTFELAISASTLLCTVITLRLHHEMGDARVPDIARLMVRYFRWNSGFSYANIHPGNEQRDNIAFTKETDRRKARINGTTVSNTEENEGERTNTNDRQNTVRWDHVSDAFDMMMFTIFLIAQIIAKTTFLALITT